MAPIDSVPSTGDSSNADVIVLGSGPAGVAVAWPMVEAGLNVLMLEAGERLEFSTPPRDRWSRSQLRQQPLSEVDPRAWDFLLGENRRVLRPQTHKFPKLRFLLGDDCADRFLLESQIHANNFDAHGVFARGGLSNVWGAGASKFDENAMAKELPFPVSDLRPSFQAVAERIGISGSSTDDMAAYHGLDVPLQPPLPLNPLSQAILERYERSRHKLSMQMGRSRLAVLSADHGRRRKCKLDAMCAYGCTEDSIYNSADEIPVLETHSNFSCRDHSRVTRIQREVDGYAIHTAGRDLHPGHVYHAPKVVVATGVLNTTRLVLRLLERFDEDVPVLDVPTVAFGLIAPRLLGLGLPKKSFAFSQLTFKCDVPSMAGEYVSGSLYSGDHFHAADLIPRVPLSFAGARTVIRRIMPALLFGTMWFPSRFGQSQARLERCDGIEDHQLVINGAFSSDYPQARLAALKQFKNQLRQLGVFPLPGGIEFFVPGGSARVGGTLPMGSRTTAEGEVIGAPHLYVADASSLPCMQPKSIVMTAMANADRIGRIIAKRSAMHTTQWPESDSSHEKQH